MLQNEYARALSAAESALTIATQSDDGELLWYARTLVGKAQLKLERGPQAYNSFTNAISTVESLRAETSVATGEYNRSLPYLSAIDFLMSQHRPSEAFHYAERAKIEFLVDLLKNNNAIPSKGLSPDQRREEKRLSGEVASLEIQLERDSEQRSSSEARRSDLRNRLQIAHTAYADFRQKVFSANPGLKVSRGELAPLKLEDISPLITDTGTALIEYTITENNTYLFVLTADRTGTKTLRRNRQFEINLKVYPLEIKYHELASKVRNFDELLTSRADNFREPAQELYDILVKPAEAQIAFKTKLVIVPDGLLWRLPFEALQPAEDHYLVDSAEVSYAPSLSALREMRKQPAPNGRFKSLLAAYASPDLSKEFTTRFEFAYPGIRLEPPAEQQEEIKRIATIYGVKTSRLSAGPQANAEQIQSGISRARILHFAVPVILDDTSAMSSFVTLSSGPGQQDGFFNTRKIMELESPVELVVAPAAQHSSGFNGNAAVGFSWAWFVAGARATLISRWKVESPALSPFLSEFYSSIKPNGRTPVSRARALRQSVLTIRRSADYQHPYYWAGFAMIGDAR